MFSADIWPNKKNIYKYYNKTIVVNVVVCSIITLITGDLSTSTLSSKHSESTKLATTRTSDIITTEKITTSQSVVSSGSTKFTGGMVTTLSFLSICHESIKITSTSTTNIFESFHHFFVIKVKTVEFEKWYTVHILLHLPLLSFLRKIWNINPVT